MMNTAQFELLDSVGDIAWTTLTSHPFSGLSYQEGTTEYGRVARVNQNGYEVVSPDFDTEAVLRQYGARVRRVIVAGELTD